MNVPEAIKEIADQAGLYGDEGEWRLDWPETLEELWEAWSQADRLRWAAAQLKAHLQLKMEELVPDGAEVVLGDDFWRYGTEGRWEASDQTGLIEDILGALGTEAPLQIAAIFNGFRVTALDAYAARLGFEPEYLRRQWAHYKGGDERHLRPTPVSRAPKRANDMQHGAVRP